MHFIGIFQLGFLIASSQQVFARRWIDVLTSQAWFSESKELEEKVGYGLLYPSAIAISFINFGIINI